MPRTLREHAADESEQVCPVCMEHTENNWFCFPCGHGICVDCNDKMIARRFLACPTCRTPREGVSPHQVEMANQARVDVDDDYGFVNMARYPATVFLPDESGGANPFGSLLHAVGSPLSAPSVLRPEDEDEALAQVLQAEEMVGQHLPLTRTTSIHTSVHEPMQDLLDQLLEPGTINGFLAQRDAVLRNRFSNNRPRLVRRR